MLIFAAAAVASVAASFYWRRRFPLRGGDPLLNNRALGYVGTEAELVGAIGPGHGRVRIADSTWPAAGPELPAGNAGADHRRPRRRAPGHAGGG